MNKSNLKSMLKVIRDLDMRNRVAYKDYLGEKTVTTTTLFCSGVLPDGEGQLDAGNAKGGFTAGETYDVVIDGIAETCVAYKFNGQTEAVGNTADLSEDDCWVALKINGVWAGGAKGSYVGKTITVSQTKTEVVKRYDVKKLPEELLPDGLNKRVKAARDAANAAKVAADGAADDAHSASIDATTANTVATAAKTTAETAKTTAETAKTTAENGRVFANIEGVPFGVPFSLSNVMKNAGTVTATASNNGVEVTLFNSSGYSDTATHALAFHFKFKEVKAPYNLVYCTRYVKLRSGVMSKAIIVEDDNNVYYAVVNINRVNSGIRATVTLNKTDLFQSVTVDYEVFNEFQKIPAFLLETSSEEWGGAKDTVPTTFDTYNILNSRISKTKITLNSSTSGSTKQFKLAIDDTGALLMTDNEGNTTPVVSDDHINTLIDTKLGVIENGTY